MATLAEMLRQGADRLINLPSEAQRFVTNPQAFTQLLTGKNSMPRETGFAAGATGLPAQEMSVLDPNQAAYMQGYSQGEPIGYAGMAAPFAAPAAVATAKALAPKAGQMAENYMVRQGMIQPLTAYHGTPHTIQGQFDINKVGTGEGAQAYGHGMYFAQNPAVAKEYQRTLSGRTDLNQQPSDPAFIHAVESFRQAGTPLDKIPVEMKKAYKSATDKDIQLAIQSTEKGNLYKVDLPDADIPNMLNWDLPISQQSAKVQELAKQLDPNLLADTPHLIVRGQPRHWTEVVDKIEDLQNPKVIKLLKKIYGESAEIMPYGDYLASKMTGEQLYRNLSNPTQWSKEAAPYAMKAGMEDAAVSARLNELGIKGIRYLDEGSRNADQRWIAKHPLGGENDFASLEQAQAFINKYPKDKYTLIEPKPLTSNFVVFEPSTVKILEKNDQPVTRKELIQQQIEKIE